MFRCQTGMSCKHPGKGDHFKVVEMFVPNKASFPIDDFVFCERKCFQHQRLILLIFGAGGINLGSVQSWNGHSQVQSYYQLLELLLWKLQNVRNQIIENLDVPIFFLKKIPQHLSLSFKKYLNPKRIPKLLSFVEGLVLVHRRHKLAIMSGLDPDLTRLCYKGTARRQSPARKAFEK